MLSLQALACVSFAFLAALNEAKETRLVQEFNSRSDESQSRQDPLIGNWSNLTARDNFTASIIFQNGGFVGTWLAPSPRATATFACSPYTPGPWAYSCYFYDLGIMLANISSSSSGWQVTWSDSSTWGPKASSANVTQVQANMTLTGVNLASLSPTQQTSIRNSVGAAIAAEAGVPPNAVSVTLTQVSFLLLSQLESSQTGSIRVSATISGVPTGSASTLSRSLSSSSTLPSTVSSSIKGSTGLTVTASAATATVVSTQTWTVLYTAGYTPSIQLTKDNFNAAVRSSTGIVRRECSSCSTDYKDIYYRRSQDLSTWDAYGHLLTTWTADSFKTKWNLYSTLSDAQAGTNAWAFCNGDDTGVGFPRDCGRTGAIGGQWNSLTKGGQSSYRFSVLVR